MNTPLVPSLSYAVRKSRQALHFGACLLCFASAVLAQQEIVYDLSDTVLAGGGGANTFFVSNGNPSPAGLTYSGGGSPTLTYTLSANTGDSGLTHLVANFPTVTLADIGESITLDYTFTPSSASAFTNNLSGALRIGFFNSGGTPLTTNLTTGGATVLRNDSGYHANYRPRGGSPTSTDTLYQRFSGTTSTYDKLWYWSSPVNVAVAGAPILTSPGTGPVTGSLTLTLVETGVEITSIVNGGAPQSVIDTSGTLTTFDSLSIATRTGMTNPTLIFTDLAVSKSLPPWTPADFGDRLWLDWWAEDVADGPVSLWTSRNGPVNATQGTTANQPVKQNGEVFFANDKRLNIPAQGDAILAHRAIMILFRIDLTGSGSGCIFTVNGLTGGANRQPFVGYNRGTNQVIVQWSTPGDLNALRFTVPENANQWHCLVSRRVGDTHYASLDGKQADGATPGESAIVMADWAMEDGAAGGFMGNNVTSAPPMALDSVMIVQDEMSLEEAQKLMGWGMWRRGIQSQLPAGHPYHDAPPPYSEPEYVFAESSEEEWADFEAFWNNGSLLKQYKGTPINLTGWNLVFQDEFNTHSVTHDVRGKGNWFAPTHGAPCGSAVAVRPAYNSSDPTVGTEGTPVTYIQSGSSMTIRMQNSNGWKSGAFCSVNKNGYGRTWMYPYLEVRMKIGPSSTGNTKGAWPAIWVKSENSFYNLCESYLEYDVYEGYISDNKGFHTSVHNWPAFRKLPGRLQTHRWDSDYLGLVAPSGWYQNVNLFDGQYHTYGVMVTPDYVINTFDGRETLRFPTPIEFKQPLWTLVDLALFSEQASQAAGIYELTIDYIRVYQNPDYAP